MEQRSFGNWLKLKRKALDLTREQLAERVGYSAATIRKIEDEERHPSTQVVERLADIFQISQDERESFLRFARGDLKSAPIETNGVPPWRASIKSPRSNIPAATTSLIGRASEIALVREYLSNNEIRLVTLLGPPGIGKTRLSMEAAREVLSDFPDGVFFVALAPLNDPGGIAQTIARSLGYVQASDLPIEEQLREGIGGTRILLLLDNCEHLIEAIAALTSHLLSTCSHLKILATSRESFRIGGEWLYPVPAFDLPEEISSITREESLSYPALMLFAERARAVQPGFTLNSENIKAVSAICAHLDGLPLVIELIAARMRLMTPQALLDRLSGRFVLTADGMRAASERQKTLYNAIDWSYKLLPPEEQKLFAYLSVFSGGFTLKDVESVFSQAIAGTSISNLVASLLDKSLLQLVSSAETSTEPRYTMLFTIQEFALQHLRIFGEEEQARNQHFIYFLHIARKADAELRGPKQLDGLSCLKESSDNARSALDWAIETGQTANALQLVRKLHWYLMILANHTEARQWFRRVLKMPDVPSYPEIHAEVLAQVANHTFLQISALDVKPYSEQALSIARAHQDKHNTARALVMLALALIGEKNFAAARAALEESQALFQEVQDEWGYGMSVQISGWSASQQENWSAALVQMEEALTIFKKLGDQYFMSVVLRGIGTAQVMQGDPARGETAMKEALVLAQKMDSKLEIAWNLTSLGEVAQRAKRWMRAVQLCWASRNILDSIGAWQELNDLQFENDLAPCRAALSEAEFAEAEAQGRAMTMEQAIAYALEDQD